MGISEANLNFHPRHNIDLPMLHEFIDIPHVRYPLISIHGGTFVNPARVAWMLIAISNKSGLLMLRDQVVPFKFSVRSQKSTL